MISSCVLLLVTTMASVPIGSQEGENQTGPTWQVGPDADLTWEEATAWAASLGGSWRMPSIEELQALYEVGITFRDWGPFQNSGYRIWSGETRDGISAWFFDFDQGIAECGEFAYRRSRCYFHGLRAFAILMQ